MAKVRWQMSLFNRPLMTVTSLENTLQFETAYEQMRKADHIVTFMRDEKREFRCLYSDLGEEEYLMLTILFTRNLELLHFVKLAILDVERYRENPAENHDFSYRALHYIKTNQHKNLYFKP